MDMAQLTVSCIVYIKLFLEQINIYVQSFLYKKNLTFIWLDLRFFSHGCCNIKYTGYVMTSNIKEMVLKADNK